MAQAVQILDVTTLSRHSQVTVRQSSEYVRLLYQANCVDVNNTLVSGCNKGKMVAAFQQVSEVPGVCGD